MMQKKGVGLSLEAIVIAALVLFVLVILMIIFRVQITDIAKGFTGISKDAQSKAEESKGSLSDLFGKCEKGENKCSTNTLMVCKNGVWEIEQDCEKENKICEENKCKEKNE